MIDYKASIKAGVTSFRYKRPPVREIIGYIRGKQNSCYYTTNNNLTGFAYHPIWVTFLKDLYFAFSNLYGQLKYK